MDVRDGFVGTIGNTPLVRLRQASEETGCEILAKAEFLNPGGSVKDRAALAIIQDAEAGGALKPGGVIVEGTAGNTGIGLALVGNARGYRTVIVIPETQSQEKKDMLRLCGAELKEVPAVPYKDPNNYVHVSGRLAEELNQSEPNGAIWARQFDNQANRRGHYETTGPEIWQQTGGKVDGFICAVGTGGTLAGVAMALKERNPQVRIGLADPPGAALYNYYANGELKAEGSSISEGIGQGRITGNLEELEIDFPFQIPDEESVPVTFDLLRHEGFVMGASSGVNVAGAKRLAKELGPGHTVVTILCDWGTRYVSKLWNPAFLREKGLPVPDWLEN
ncbi:cysteine synthase A [Rhodovibrio sodomensis]|uniref:Cysteine synthase A n=1 Tax=Rhodovibrio sodomensis TaxID=1088 RepID=A0ABS1DFL2_9PROT|nr:cysteine synthase A [Rhodovibrio sodomensis]MBK1668313.1 cysteine synthase A [Rhodovibrio sodomensis]